MQLKVTEVNCVHPPLVLTSTACLEIIREKEEKKKKRKRERGSGKLTTKAKETGADIVEGGLLKERIVEGGGKD